MSSRFWSFSHQSGQQKKVKKFIKTHSTLKDTTFLTYNLTIMMEKKTLTAEERSDSCTHKLPRGEEGDQEEAFVARESPWRSTAVDYELLSYVGRCGWSDENPRKNYQENPKSQIPKSHSEFLSEVLFL
jgi:hypothetical protein